ncbi:hypothetical protein WR25_02452 [Diploscapter pachys]|uniref:Uncharacterized protein n=1 Tax=Diploscapter pachys TaxID=2018661 RepID=A0A2A2KKS8_9BILA|nr:hypothetical protein WR25_02452 [Diploscapter pachys]
MIGCALPDPPEIYETVTLSKRSKLKVSLEMAALSVLRSRKSNKKELTSKPPSKARNRKVFNKQAVNTKQIIA